MVFLLSAFVLVSLEFMCLRALVSPFFLCVHRNDKLRILEERRTNHHLPGVNFYTFLFVIQTLNDILFHLSFLVHVHSKYKLRSLVGTHTNDHLSAVNF